MKYGMRERISGGVVLVGIAVILVLFFFGRPGHRETQESAPDVSLNQQPVSNEAQGFDPQQAQSSVSSASESGAAPTTTSATVPTEQGEHGASAVTEPPATGTSATLHPLPSQSAPVSQTPSAQSAGPMQHSGAASGNTAGSSSSHPTSQPLSVTQAQTAAHPSETKSAASKPSAEKARPSGKLASNDPIMNAADAHKSTPSTAAPTGKSAAAAPAAVSAANAPASGWSVQGGSFGNQDNAQRLVQHLSQNGFKAYTLKREANTVVLVGPFSSSQAAEEARMQMQQRTGTNGLVVRNGKH